MARPRKYETEAERRSARRHYNREWKLSRMRLAPAAETHPLRLWRMKVHLTQREAGVIIGVSATTISSYERGISPTPKWLLAWLRAGALTEKKAREKLARMKEE